jgi:hypothetical protein
MLLRFLSAVRRLFTRLVLVGTLATLGVSCAGSLRQPPVGPLNIDAPLDRLTAARLAAMARDPALCTAILRQGRVAHTPLPPLSAGRCGYTNAVRLQSPGAAFRPDNPGMTCQMAAATHLWLREVVQPAAQTHFGARVTGIDHFGTYACRNIYGRAEGDISEHARANALDVAGFRLSGGRQVSVLRHWNGSPQERAFLREVRDGACRLYGTTLSPDYNQAHADHFHLDMAVRGGGHLFGGFCR